jgi:hypothetical protein
MQRGSLAGVAGRIAEPFSSINVMVAERRAMSHIPPAPTLVAFRRPALSSIGSTATIYKWKK